MATLLERIKNWNVFKSKEPDDRISAHGMTVTYGSARPWGVFSSGVATERSILAGIHTQIAMDVAAVSIRHVLLDDNGNLEDYIKSGLNDCLNLEANIDQAATAFRQDIAASLLEDGYIAVVPVDTSVNPDTTGSYTIHTMRVGKIVGWFPRHVLVNLYNDETGKREDVYLSKTTVAIIHNPLYAVMNEPDGTLKRLVRKLALADSYDEEIASGKLDIIIQLPYTVKTDLRKKQAEERRNDIEMQLTGSKYGIAYADATEKITQLNRPAENNLMKQIELLSAELYAKLGITEAVFNGTADEATMLNYYNRTIEPILTAITEEFKRTFLTKTAVTQGHSIEFYRDPFKLLPISQIAEIADKFTRNEIMSSNELRSKIAMKPSKEKGADELRNSNMKDQDTAVARNGKPELEAKFEKIPKQTNQQEGGIQNGT